MLVNYFVLDGVVADTTIMTTMLLLISFALQWVSFVSLIENVADVFGIAFADIGMSILTQTGQWTYLKLIAFTTIPAVVLYVTFCSAMDLYFYHYKRRHYKIWKWQVDRFPSTQDRLEMLWLSCRNLFIGAIYTSSLLTWNPFIFNIYTDVTQRGTLYYIGSVVAFFLHIDIMAYTSHRIMHRPFLYRNIHKIHHKFIAVSPMTALSMHWIDYLTQVTLTYTYLWIIPTHINVAIINLLYVFVFNVINHSGIKIGSHLYWEPTTQYHDDHHKYFHVNYGQSLILWDWMCGTLRTHRGNYNENKFD